MYLAVSCGVITLYTYQEAQVRQTDSADEAAWINITPPVNPEELDTLSQRLGIPLDFLQDSLDIDERSRYEIEDDVTLIVLNTPIVNDIDPLNTSFYVTVPIGIILTPDHVVTISRYDNPILNKFTEKRVRGLNPNDRGLFVLKVFEANVIRFLSCLQDLNHRRNLLERELYNSSRNKELKELLNIEKSLVYFVTALSSNELLKLKMKRTDVLRIRDVEDANDLFEDVIIDNSQALEMSNTYTNILSGTMDAFASIISNNLNNVIKRLTLVTIILMVPTLITSFFGMNLKSGLESNAYAMWLVGIASVLISIIFAVVSRRNRWF